ncbi:MAG: DUF192 domain-containing protein [bacterium]
MKKLIYIVILLVVVVGIAGCGSKQQGATVKIDNTIYNVEVVKSYNDKKVGLSNHTNLAENNGMIFVYDDKAVRGFWMKDMDFNIDIIWIDDNIIKHIEHNVPKPKSEDKDLPVYKPQVAVNYVLEIPAEDSKKYQMSEGDQVEISLP